jgi:hypothetical protein
VVRLLKEMMKGRRTNGSGGVEEDTLATLHSF